MFKKPKVRRSDASKYVLYFDGSCYPNNPGGAMGAGFVIKDDQFPRQTIRTGRRHFDAHPSNSNNKAEYLALIAGLEALLDMGAQKERIRCIGDSNLVISQMEGEWNAYKDKLYYPAYLSAQYLAHQFKHLRYMWYPRHLNQEADALSKPADSPW